MTSCKICKNKISKTFKKITIHGKLRNMVKCSVCDFISYDKIDWLKLAYKNTYTDQDHNKLLRSIWAYRLIKTIIKMNYDDINKLKILDFGSGYGITPKLLQNSDLNVFSYDKYDVNIFSTNHLNDINNLKKNIDIIYAIEVFEHLENPIHTLDFLDNLNFQLLIFTTELHDQIQNLEKWNYLGKEHGQHINFFGIKTLNILAKKYNLNFYTDKKWIHIFSKKKLSFFLILKLKILMRLKYSFNPWKI